MPLLYQSRQHRRNGYESLDCAIALQELQNLGVNKIITFDIHDYNKGINKFNEANKNNYFNKLYTTNLTYVDEKIQLENWYYKVDCLKQIAELINDN